MLLIVIQNFPSLCYIKLLDVDPQDQGEEDGAVVDLDSQRKGKCAVIKTSTRQVINWQMYRNVVKLMKLSFCMHWHLTFLLGLLRCNYAYLCSFNIIVLCC